MPPKPPWSDLPLELAGLVLGRVPAHIDRVRSAAVCRQWRAAVREVPLPPPMPLLAVPDGTAYSLPLHTPLCFPACTGYASAASGNWLLFLSPGDGGRCCFLRDPFSGATMLLPARSRVRLRYENPDGSAVYGRAAAGTSLAVMRLLLCSPGLVVAHGMFQLKSRIAVCKPSTASWWSVFIEIGDGLAPLLGAMAFHQGMLFAIGKNSGHLYTIDIDVDRITGDPWVSQVRLMIGTVLPCPPPIIRQGSGIFMETLFYLVESRGALLMVRRRMQMRWTQQEGGSARTGWNEFDVFEADLQGCRWTQVATIGDDQVLFLSEHQSRSFCVSQLGMPGDCIIFFENDDENRGWFSGQSTSSSCIVYNMRGRKLDHTLLPKAFRWKCGMVGATWLFPEDDSSKVC